MKLGLFDLIAISDGSFFLDGGTMFGVVPKVLWEKIYKPDELNRLEIPLNCLLVKAAGVNILIDTGIGNKLDEKFRSLYCVKQEHNLINGIRHAGLTPEHINFVVNTHLHFDHCGWNTIVAPSDQNSYIPTFPKATYIIQKEEWYDATHPNERTRASYFKENFLPLEISGQLTLIEGEYEIVPGVKVMNTIGHTKGHQSVIIESKGKKALYCGDFMPTSAHIRIPYLTSFDLYPLDLVELKKKLLRQIIDEHWLLIFEHDPMVIFAYLEEENGKQILKPIKTENSEL